MNIQNLEAFIHVAWFGTLSKAAEMLYLTQPSISSRIQSLEREIGYQLFQREGRNVVMTDVGKVFLPFAENIIKMYRESKMALYCFEEGAEAEIVIASSLSISTYFLPLVLPDFRAKFPSVNIKIQTGQAPQILDMVLRQRAHFGLTRSISHPKLKRTPLFSDPFLLTVYPTHPFASRSTVTLEEVSTSSLLLFDQGSADWSLVYGMFRSQGMTPNVILNIESIHAIKELVQNKIGVSFLPYMAIKEELAKGDLIRVNVENAPSIQRQIDFIELDSFVSTESIEFFKTIAIEKGNYYASWSFSPN